VRPDVRVGRRVAARRASDRRLVDLDDLVDLPYAVEVSPTPVYLWRSPFHLQRDIFIG
jgi:hypothetical protein